MTRWRLQVLLASVMNYHILVTTISTFLAQCLNYPSGDNCQPFRFEVTSPMSFAIYHDGKLARHRLNFSNTASLISFGTLLETISLNAKSKGLGMEISAINSAAFTKQSLEKWAEISLHRTDQTISATDQDLAGSLALRCVDRRLYDSAPLPDTIVQWLMAEAKRNPHLAFGFHRRPGRELESLLLRIEETAWKDLPLAVDVLKWLRFDERSALKTRDGMNWPTLCLSSIQKPFLKVAYLAPALYKIAAELGSTKGNRNALKSQLEHSGGFGWMALTTSDPSHIIDASRTMFRMWLYLNGQGYGFQPLSMATLPAFERHFNGLPPDWPRALEKSYDEVIRRMQEDLNLKSEFIPFWGFRTGKSEPVSAAARTFRRDIDELLIDRRNSTSNTKVG